LHHIQSTQLLQHECKVVMLPLLSLTSLQSVQLFTVITCTPINHSRYYCMPQLPHNSGHGSICHSPSSLIQSLPCYLLPSSFSKQLCTATTLSIQDPRSSLLHDHHHYLPHHRSFSHTLILANHVDRSGSASPTHG
jgi:hypothetical protein